MSSRVLRTTHGSIALTVVLTVVLGLAVLPGPASASFDNGLCSGASPPQDLQPGNQAPVLTDDSTTTVSGNLVRLRVLANDSDPDGDKLYLTGTSTPVRGEVCAAPAGFVEYYAPVRRKDYTVSFTYGVTDREHYRTARITVHVEGVTPVRAVLKKRLLLKKHSHRVKRPALVSFTNPNTHRILLLAGDFNKARPDVQRVVYPGRTTQFRTRLRQLFFVVGIYPAPKTEPIFLNTGNLATRTGRQSVYFEQEARVTSDAPAAAARWWRVVR